MKIYQNTYTGRATAFCQNPLTYQKNPLVSLADRADQFWKIRYYVTQLMYNMYYLCIICIHSCSDTNIMYDLCIICITYV